MPRCLPFVDLPTAPNTTVAGSSIADPAAVMTKEHIFTGTELHGKASDIAAVVIKRNPLKYWKLLFGESSLGSLWRKHIQERGDGGHGVSCGYWMYKQLKYRFKSNLKASKLTRTRCSRSCTRRSVGDWMRCQRVLKDARGSIKLGEGQCCDLMRATRSRTCETDCTRTGKKRCSITIVAIGEVLTRLGGERKSGLQRRPY